jgi:hypothetical protein
MAITQECENAINNMIDSLNSEIKALEVTLSADYIFDRVRSMIIERERVKTEPICRELHEKCKADICIDLSVIDRIKRCRTGDCIIDKMEEIKKELKSILDAKKAGLI